MALVLLLLFVALFVGLFVLGPPDRLGTGGAARSARGPSAASR